MADFRIKGRFTGSIAGNYTSDSSWVRHGLNTSDPWTIAHAVDTIPVATFGGKTGGLTILIESMSIGGNRPAEAAKFMWTIVGCTGDLKGLHGHGTGTPTGAAIVIYEGEAHFEP